MDLFLVINAIKLGLNLYLYVRPCLFTVWSVLYGIHEEIVT
jgi:hypothetical protein